MSTKVDNNVQIMGKSPCRGFLSEKLKIYLDKKSILCVYVDVNSNGAVGRVCLRRLFLFLGVWEVSKL